MRRYKIILGFLLMIVPYVAIILVRDYPDVLEFRIAVLTLFAALFITGYQIIRR